ncbi:MAG: GDP-mannose 4,6-dehydratase [Hyphomicrobium sp.]|nr:GDP-mannose 4,6-dehydratase [Hyphomicrobium sp.]
MAMLLHRLDAKVFGLALAPVGQTLFEVANVASDVDHTVGDIRDLDTVKRVFAAAKPSVVLHLAAQPLVRRSYAQPVETYATKRARHRARSRCCAHDTGHRSRRRHYQR